MKGKTQSYYDKNPDAAKVKAEYQKAFNARPKNKRRRAALNKYNRDHGTYGNGDKKDASHKRGKIVGFEPQRVNRARRERSRLRGSKRS
jgi:hypothetical protein